MKISRNPSSISSTLHIPNYKHSSCYHSISRAHSIFFRSYTPLSTSRFNHPARLIAMSPPPLQKQYMSTAPPPTAKKQPSPPRPSASILLLSPTNEILLLHRVSTSSSFASAHVFPGGNLESSDGPLPPPTSPDHHIDSPTYRLGAIRECFEESGILLAHHKNTHQPLRLDPNVINESRKKIHKGELGFREWVESNGGIVDIDGLRPFTRWITPPNLPKRFTTQMYLYFLPVDATLNSGEKKRVDAPTTDGGLEHTTASFASPAQWLDRARRGEIILFPPQFYLMYLLAPLLEGVDVQEGRKRIEEFLKGDGGDGRGVKWGDKVMSPLGLFMSKKDGRSVLGLEKPGRELEGSGRGGDGKRVVLVRFGKEGPREVEVREKEDVLKEEKMMVGEKESKI